MFCKVFWYHGNNHSDLHILSLTIRKSFFFYFMFLFISHILYNIYLFYIFTHKLLISVFFGCTDSPRFVILWFVPLQAALCVPYVLHIRIWMFLPFWHEMFLAHLELPCPTSVICHFYQENGIQYLVETSIKNSRSSIRCGILLLLGLFRKTPFGNEYTNMFI